MGESHVDLDGAAVGWVNVSLEKDLQPFSLCVVVVWCIPVLMDVYIYVCPRRSEVKVKGLPGLFPLHVLRQGLSLNLEIIRLAKAGQ